MAKRKPRRAKAAKAAAKKKSTRAATSRKSARRRVSAKRPSARKAARKAAKKTARKAAKKAAQRVVARKAAARKSMKRAAKKKAAKKRAPARKAPLIGIAPVQPAALPKAAKTVKAPRPKRAPTLDRARKTVGDGEPHGLPSSLDLERTPSAARSGSKELTDKLREHTSTGPAITAGDVDANWEDAESVGDEAPGGDNPAPDQDVVDDIGRALGVQYEDEEELKGGDEITSRDRHRWELDPASSDDYDERD